MADENIMEKEEKYLDIYPIKKGKRMLVFLADFFICFILAIFTFTMAVFPSAMAIVNYQGLSNDIANDGTDEINLYIDNKLLFTKGEDTLTFSMKLNYSQTLFLSYCINTDNLANNPFHTFYVDICSKDINYLNEVIKTNDFKEFFSYENKDSNGIYSLKDEYKTMFSPVLDEQDEMTSEGSSYYDSFTSSFFLKTYNSMVKDIREDKILPSDSSLRQCKELYSDSQAKIKKMDNTVIYSAFIAYGIVVLITYLAVPLINKKGKTMGMMILKAERVGSDNMRIISKPERVIQFAYYFVSNLACLFFVPMGYISFDYLFNLPVLGYISIVAAVYLIVSMLFIIFNQFNKSLTDFLTKTTILDNQSLDDIQKAKGYGYDNQDLVIH